MLPSPRPADLPHRTSTARWLLLYAVLGLVLLSGGLPSTARATASGADCERASAPLAARFGDHVVTEPIMAVTVMPGEAVPVSGMRCDTPVAVSIHTPADTARWQPAEAPWSFVAPETPGLHPVTLTDDTGASVQLQVFVLEPWSHEGTRMAGYRIGRYEAEPRRGLDAYERPGGFIRVTEAMRTTQIAPNFQLEQFLSKQTRTFPQFVLVDTALLQLLEAVLGEVRKRGHSVPTLHVMSGFRTPHYNRRIGNTTTYSRHLYGDAADIFVDANANGRMDDLTGTGRVSRADAERLAAIVEAVKNANGDAYVGGLGVYGPAPHRGPFVHVDLRGYRARW